MNLAFYRLAYEGSTGVGAFSQLITPDDVQWLPAPGVDTTGIVAALIEAAQSGHGQLSGVTSIDGTASYSYDATGQLVGAEYASGVDEYYSYDANGNRTMAGYVVGAGNRLLSDGTYWYQYDAEGNRTARFIDVDQSQSLTVGDTDVTQYAWDGRNRLASVATCATFGGGPSQIVGYRYDVQNRWIGESIDSNGDGQTDHQTHFAYDGHQIAMQFDKNGAGDATGADLSHRYLWQPNVVDQLMADERTHVDAGNIVSDEVLWALTDQQGSVSDMAKFDAVTGAMSVVDHVVRDSFGKVVSGSGPSEGSRAGYQGRLMSGAAGLLNYVNRWTDPGTANWLSQDPMGFAGWDTNVYRYVGNGPTNATDPAGLRSERVSTTDAMKFVDAAIDATMNDPSVRAVKVVRGTSAHYFIKLDRIKVGIAKPKYMDGALVLYGLSDLLNDLKDMGSRDPRAIVPVLEIHGHAGEQQGIEVGSIGVHELERLMNDPTKTPEKWLESYVDDTNAADFARKLMASNNLADNAVIVLSSCNLGNFTYLDSHGGKSVAQIVANITRRPVLTPGGYESGYLTGTRDASVSATETERVPSSGQEETRTWHGWLDWYKDYPQAQPYLKQLVTTLRDTTYDSQNQTWYVTYPD